MEVRGSSVWGRVTVSAADDEVWFDLSRSLLFIRETGLNEIYL